MNSEKDLFQKLKNLSASDLANIVIPEEDEATIEIIPNQPLEEPKELKAETKKAMDYAIRILSLRDYSTHKMKEKLQARKHGDEVINEVISKLEEYNYLRDEDYARMRIKQLLIKGYADNYIIQKCKQEKLPISLEQIDEIRQEQNLSTQDLIHKLIDKKLRGKTIPNEFEPKMKLKNKIISFLASKGYNFGDISNALTEYF